MMTTQSTYRFVSRAIVFAALAGSGAAVATAQQAQTPAAGPATPLNLQLPASTSRDALFSSSSADSPVTDGNLIANNEKTFDFVAAANGTQPPPRRYGRPRYRGGNTNADGSNKWVGMVGAGFTQPVYDTGLSLNPHFSAGVGAGRQFSRNLSIPIEVNYDRFGFTAQTLANQNFIYGTQGAGLDGNTHIWSVSVNPTLNVYKSEGAGMYLVGGVGFYHKVADFTLPATGTTCDYFGYCYQYSANQVVDHYFSNAPGFNGGIGLTYKISRFNTQKFFVEARYVYINDQYKPGFTVNNISQATATSSNFFPQNSLHTTYVPVKAGIRF